MAAWRTVLVIVLLIASSLFVWFPTDLVQEADGWKSPGTGQTYNLTTLWQTVGGGLIDKLGPGFYNIHDSITISQNDELIINDTINNNVKVTINMDPDKALYIDGDLEIIGTDQYNVDITVLAGTWEGIYLNTTSNAVINYTNLWGATTALRINGSAPLIMNSNIHDNDLGVEIFNGAAPEFSRCRIFNSTSMGVSCKNSTLLMNENCNVSDNLMYGLYLQYSTAMLDNITFYDNLWNGIFMDRSNNSEILNQSRFYYNGATVPFFGGIFAKYSSFMMNDTIFFDNNMSAINLSFGSSATINNTRVEYSSNIGIHVYNSSLIADSINVSRCRIGVFAYSNADVKIHNFTGYFNSQRTIHVLRSNDVVIDQAYIQCSQMPTSQGRVGIHINHSTGVSLTNVSISYARTYSLHIFDSTVAVNNITFFDSNLYAIYIDKSNNVTLGRVTATTSLASDTVHVANSRDILMDNHSILQTNKFFCFFVTNGTVWVTNTSIAIIIGGSFRLRMDSHITLLNASCLDTSVSITDNGTSDIKRYHFLNVNTTNEGGGHLGGSRVRVADPWNNTIYLTKSDNSSDESKIGRCYWLVLYESYQNKTGIYYNNTYKVYANFTGFEPFNQSFVIKGGIKWVHAWLYTNFPPGDVKNILPIVTHNNLPKITWDATTDPDGDDVSYHLRINDSVMDIVDINTPNTYYQVTTPLNFQVYNINISAIDENGNYGNFTNQTLTIYNNKPTSPVIQLQPGTPHTDNNLLLSFIKESEDDDIGKDPTNYTELVRYTVKWFKNGLEQAGLEKTNQTHAQVNNTAIARTLTSINEVWKVEVTAYDGHGTQWNLDGSSGGHSNATPVSAQVTVTNRAPYLSVAINDFSIPEDTVDSTTVNLKTAFKDYDMQNDTDTLTFGATGWTNINVAINSGTGAVTFTPALNWNGFEDITFTATDSYSASAQTTVRVTVTAANDPPVIDPVPDLVAYEDIEFIYYVHGNDSADGDTLTYSTNLTVAVTGLTSGTNYFEETTSYGLKIRFTADNSMVGNYTIQIKIDDGMSQPNSIVTDEFKLQIVNTNDAPDTPIISAPTDNSEYLETTEITFTCSGTDDDVIWGDILTFRWHSNLDGQFGTGTSVKTSTLTVGTHTITLKVTDDTLTASASITVKILEKVEDVVAEANLLTPKNDTTINTLWVDVTWESKHEKASEFTYDVYLSEKVVPFLDPAKVSNTDKLTANISGLEDGKTYYWGVIPKYKGVSGNPSEIFHFDVNIIYERPTPTATLLSPADKSTTTSTTVELEWISTHENKADFTYEVYWSKTELNYNSLPTPNVKDIGADVFKHHLTGLDDETTYYWTVVPVDMDGKRGTLTNTAKVWSFTVNTKGGSTEITAVLLEPGDAKPVTASPVVLKWKSDDANAGSYKYRIYVSESEGTVLDNLVSTLMNTELEYTVTDNTTYYWTVIPVYQSTDGVCLSGIWSFEVNFGWKEEHKLEVSGGKDTVIDAGDSTTMTISVKNTGNVDETLEITLDAGGLGGASVSPDKVTITPEATETVTVTITIPDDAPDGKYTLKVKFTPEGETVPLAEETFQVTVNEAPEEDGVEGLGGMLGIGIAIVVIIVVVIIVLFLLMKRKKEGGEGGEGEGEGEERMETEAPEQMESPEGGGPGQVEPGPNPPTEPQEPGTPDLDAPAEQPEETQPLE